MEQRYSGSIGDIYNKVIWGVNPYSKGLKTGITKLAGQCFIGYFVYPNGNTVISECWVQRIGSVIPIWRVC